MNAGGAVLDGGGVPRGAPQALPMQPAPIMCSEAPMVLTCSLSVKMTVLYPPQPTGPRDRRIHLLLVLHLRSPSSVPVLPSVLGK